MLVKKNRHRSNPRGLLSNLATIVPTINTTKFTTVVPRSKSRTRDFSNRRNKNSKLKIPAIQEDMASIYGTNTVPKRCKSVMRNVVPIFNGRTVVFYQ